jgi:cellulose synthase/poly-beta-1,6-N-acetylglucosamine synthase-like glycosyltransferase
MLGVFVVVSACIWVGAVALLWLHPRASAAMVASTVVLGGICGGLVVHAVWPGREVAGLFVAAPVLAESALALGYARRRRELTGAGALVWVAWVCFGALTSAWSVSFLSGLHLSGTTTVLLWLAVCLALLTLPSAVVTTREGWGPALKSKSAHRPSPGRIPLVGSSPRVSIHVPCHAEPPNVVIGTLDRLADLEYDNYEVLVIDNNTADAALWLPVKDHCERLGSRFRFLHVQGITGAKAGALNWAAPHTDPEAELIAVVDADYHVEPYWLRETVGYFTDPTIGFVQAPHAYREHEASRFATWANWEYSVFFQTGMVSLDEAGAGLTVGTMSVIRKQALVEAGGWAEWCLTEDSELSIRIHGEGYRSIYLTDPYGRGLVPDTFEGYRRQRFRWTYGPVQEFRRHWRLFLPRRMGGKPSNLSARQRLHHANHGIDVIGIGVRTLALGVGVAAGISMIVQRETVQMPFELWLASTAALVTSWLMRILIYRRVVGATTGQAIGAIIAFASLSVAISLASIRASLGMSSAWHRTNKFRSRSNWRGALASAGPELSLCALCLSLASVIYAYSPAPTGVALMLCIALIAKSIGFATAPLVAVIADRDLRSTRRKKARPRNDVLPQEDRPTTPAGMLSAVPRHRAS